MSYDLDTRPLYREDPPTPRPTLSPPSPASGTSPLSGRSPRSPESPEPTALQTSVEAEPPKLELSVTQLVGGALAAMTAAALGSRLGVAGTVIGAAVASVIAGVGGALYTASLRRTRDTVRTVFRGRGPVTPVTPVIADATTRYPGVAAAVSPRVPPAPVPTPSTTARAARKVRLWPRVLIGAVATFALAGGVLTGFELVTGHALSGGTGTTIERVGSSSSGSSRTDDTPASDQTDPSVAPSASADPQASDEPTPAATDQPSATPSATPSTAAPSASPSATPSTGASTGQPSEQATTAPTG